MRYISALVFIAFGGWTIRVAYRYWVTGVAKRGYYNPLGSPRLGALPAVSRAADPILFRWTVIKTVIVGILCIGLGIAFTMVPHN
jgi:hypothetical protein